MENYKFYDANQISKYLRYSVIRDNDDNPIMVYQVTGNKSSILISFGPPDPNYWNLPGSIGNYEAKSLRVNPYSNIPNFKLTPIKNGYINYVNSGGAISSIAYFRLPCRQWSIGLTSENTLLRRCDRDGDVSKTTIFNIGFSHFCKNTFPTLSFAVDTLMNKKTKSSSIAFSRYFCVNKDLNIYNFITRNNIIGHVDQNKDGISIKLEKKYAYFLQMLEKEKIKCSLPVYSV